MLVRETPARDGDMRTLGEPQNRRGVRVVEPAQPVGPRPRRVDDHLRANGCGLSGEHVAHDGATDASVGLQQCRRLDVVRCERPRSQRAAHGRDDQACIVGLRVVIQRRPDQAAITEPGLDAPHFCCT